MAVTNEVHTIVDIKKFETNQNGYENWRPNWQIYLENKRKLKLDLTKPEGHLQSLLTPGRAYRMTIESGEYDGKAWFALRDAVVVESAPPQKTPPPPSSAPAPSPTPGPKPADTFQNGQKFGNRLTNATHLICALIEAGQIKKLTPTEDIATAYTEAFKLFDKGEENNGYFADF